METGKNKDVQASKLTAKEVISSTLKYWIGPVTPGLSTIVCNIGSMKNAALLTAYKDHIQIDTRSIM